MSREVHVRFCEGLAGKFRRSTLPIVHCSSEKQAKWIKTQIEKRLLQCKLELHPEKTKIVYCKDDNRQGNYPNETFVFLGYLFAPREAQSKYGQRFVNFSPAVSSKAAQRMCHEMKSWRFHRRSDATRVLKTCLVLVIPFFEDVLITMGSTTSLRFTESSLS